MARGFSGVKDDLIDIRRHLLCALCFFPPLADDGSDSPPATPHRQSRNPNPSPRLWRRIRDGDGGVREDLVRFVRDMDKSPESWLQFPFPVDDHFHMSSNQRDHIANVEHVAPSLAALKISLCPTVMTEQRFWKIYFALLHPRLNYLESEFLSTEQIVEEMHMNLKKRMHAAESSSLMNNDKEINTQQNELSLLNSNSQSLIAESSSSVSTKKQAKSFEYIDRWFDTSLVLRETDASTEPGRQLSSINVICYSEPQNTDNIILPITM
ncbi:uncharacterized protein A4U43_C03F31380 [Asparagus officinalis]|uniref:BSD domain-containing protein n=1 Tax=Asparagus officinalis TaxID=4686 RepID=A0A5P1FED8_ASPOF|nr:uncharacterized protein A4U43_C03F31380 [Asparagus officinalis]